MMREAALGPRAPKAAKKKPSVLKLKPFPPLKDAWKLAAFDKPNDFFGGVPLGRLYIDLAPQVPPVPTHAYQTMAQGKLSEAYENALLYFKQHGEDGLRPHVKSELKRVADAARIVVARNPFLSGGGKAP